jgi:hypothetical protein
MTKTTKILTVAVVMMLSWILPQATQAAEEETKERQVIKLNPFSRLGTSLKRSFWGWNAALHVGGIAATGTLISTGADTKVHNFFVENNQFSPYTVPGVVGGYFVPLTLGVSLATYSLLADAPRTTLAANAVLQSLLFSFTYQMILKTVTGREAPEAIHYDDNAASRRFQFGFLRNGIDWGWPSGLLLTNTAAVVSLASVYPESTLLRIAGAAYLGYLFISAPAHENAKLCWFSDAVAGLAMGFAIGRGVGSSLAGQGTHAGLLDRVALSPMLGGAGKGVVAQVRF